MQLNRLSWKERTAAKHSEIITQGQETFICFKVCGSNRWYVVPSLFLEPVVKMCLWTGDSSKVHAEGSSTFKVPKICCSRHGSWTWEGVGGTGCFLCSGRNKWWVPQRDIVSRKDHLTASEQCFGRDADRIIKSYRKLEFCSLSFF